MKRYPRRTWLILVRRPLVAALALLTMSAPLAQESVTVDTARGSATVPLKPASIVALDISVVDNLVALGVPIAGVPSPYFVKELDAAVKGVPKVGSLFEPDYEALARISPDLIVAGGRSSRLVEQLSRVAPTIDLTVWGEGHVEQALSRLTALGTITGRQGKAQALVRSFNDLLDKANEAIRGKGSALIVLTNGPKTSAYGAGSRFGWLHTSLGLPEAGPKLGAQTHGEAISFEFIAKVNPDWLLVVDRGSAIGAGGQGAESTLNNALVAGTTAWKKGQVVYLDAGGLYIAGGGISAMTRTVEQLTAAFSKAN